MTAAFFITPSRRARGRPHRRHHRRLSRRGLGDATRCAASGSASVAALALSVVVGIARRRNRRAAPARRAGDHRGAGRPDRGRRADLDAVLDAPPGPGDQGRARTAASTSRSPAGRSVALGGLAFVAVAREGLETVLFLLAIGSVERPGATMRTFVGGLVGLAAAVGIGWAIFAGRPGSTSGGSSTITGVVADLRRGGAGGLRRRTSSSMPGCFANARLGRSTSAGVLPETARSGRCWPACSATARRRRRSRSSPTSPT